MEFIESPEFTKQIKRFPDEDYRAFQIDLASDPLQGALSCADAEGSGKPAWHFPVPESAGVVEPV